MTPELSLLQMMSSASNNKCIWVSEFNERSTSKFFDKFMELEKDPEVQVIPVFINSYGGQLYSLTAMRDLIKSSPKAVTTIAVGMAMSCGASLLAAGTKGLRFASPDSDILIHQVSGGVYGKTADIEESARQYKRVNDKILDNLAQDTGKSKKFFKNIIAQKHNVDWTLSATEAKKLGIVDHVSIPRLTSPHQAEMLVDIPSYNDQLAAQKTHKPAKKQTKTKLMR